MTDEASDAVIWTAFPPPWDEVRRSLRPIFCGPPSIRPVWKMAFVRALRHTDISFSSLLRGAGVRDVLSFMIWLDTAQAFGVTAVLSPALERLPMARALRHRHPTADATDADRCIGALIIAQNEQDLLQRALQSVRPYVDDILVVDGGSTDATVDVARESGARVVHRSFDGDFSSQRNFGSTQLATPWILSIDADEVLTPELGRLIRNLVRHSWADAIFMPRVNLHVDVGEDPVSWPDMQLRLFRRHLNFAGKLHEQVVGWSRPIYVPVSGPYLEHRKTRTRAYRRALYYAELDPETFPDEWRVWVRRELERLEGGGSFDPSDD